MSIEMIAKVSEHSKTESSGLLIMIGIANSCNRGGYGWCSYDELARFARIGARQAMALVKKAKKLGEVVTMHRYGNRGQLGNLFVIMLGLTRAEKKARLQEAIASVRGVNLKPTGVKRSAPSGVQPRTPSGVQPGSSPGEVQNTPGVQPGSPDPSYIRPDPPSTDIGAAAPTPPEPAALLAAGPVEEKQHRKLTAWQERVKEMAEAVAAITGDDLNVEQTKKRVGQIAAQLLKAGYGPADTPGFHAHWKANDWRGRQGQAVTREQVLDELPRWKKTGGRLAAGSNGNGGSPFGEADAANKAFAARLRAQQAERKPK